MMRYLKHIISIGALGLAVTTTWGAMVQKRVPYTDGTTSYEGVLVYDDSIKSPVPGILMVPNWMGVTDESIEKARLIAGNKYVIFVADMYGVGVRPKDAAEAGAAAGFVRGDRDLMRARAQLSLRTMHAQKAPMNHGQTAAIGFCFGGGTVLELGRSGASVDAIVSFHGDLVSPTLDADAGKTKGHVLVLHGAEDPFVPQTDVEAFKQAMLKTEVDWQLVQFSGTVHSFTNPYANMSGQAEYNKKSAERAYAAMRLLFDETFGN